MYQRKDVPLPKLESWKEAEIPEPKIIAIREETDAFIQKYLDSGKESIAYTCNSEQEAMRLAARLRGRCKSNAMNNEIPKTFNDEFSSRFSYVLHKYPFYGRVQILQRGETVYIRKHPRYKDVDKFIKENGVLDA